MQINRHFFGKTGLSISLTALAGMLLAGCSSGNYGPAVEARPQTISFGAAPALTLSGTATVSATASSGLAVNYSSTTPAICSVDGSTGVVTDIAAGTCIIAANQSGNDTFAPAPQVTQSITVISNPSQTISFGAAPTLTLFSTATVTATATSGLKVIYSSTTPTVCSVDSSTALVTDLTAGNCVIAANQAGDAHYSAAPQATQTIIVGAWTGPVTAPGAPTGVTATAGNTSNTVMVSIGPTSSGGSPVTGYAITSTPAGLTATGSASPITVTCPSTCSGYAFSAIATNSVGNSVPSAPADVITTYNVVERFYEPDTQPNDTIFTGSFTFNSTTGAVSSLAGHLTESMTGMGGSMNELLLNHQLSTVPAPTLGGLLVTTFLLPTTNTLSNNPIYGGTDGWTPGTGSGLYYGYPTTGPSGTGIANPGNAYARIFVNTADPTVPLTQAQIDKLAYADCAAGGMMGATCMTGTTVAGYGTVGAMSGYPVSQVITKQ